MDAMSFSFGIIEARLCSPDIGFKSVAVYKGRGGSLACGAESGGIACYFCS